MLLAAAPEPLALPISSWKGLRDQRERGPGEGKGGAATAKKATRGYHTTDLKEAVT